MARKRLKMTKACIAARRRYRKKKRVGGCVACVNKNAKNRAKGRKVGGALIRRGRGRGKGRGRRRKNPQGAGWLEDVGSFISNAAQTVLPFLPMLL